MVNPASPDARGGVTQLPIGSPSLMLLFAALTCPWPSSAADGIGVEALVSGSAVTSKPEDKPGIFYADQPGSGIGGVVRVSGRMPSAQLRWIAGALVEHLQQGASFSEGHRTDKASSYRLASGCWRKKSHIRLEASMLRLVRPTNHSGIGSPPGQLWPPS